MIKLYVDAASNGKAIGIGYVLYKDKEQFPVSKGKKSRLNNHQAEFYAVCVALMDIKEQNLHEETLCLYSDSKVVVQALNRKSAKGEWQHPYLEQILPLLELYRLYFVEWFHQKDNQLPDQLAKRALIQYKE
ncbi:MULTISPECIES: RNase H family protein [unclassified Granulicatella]|uniref:RNase H family protein n=1 Tax=unclassified Granulicatella TaxID=2630493 RepID=UPI0010738E0E|nr:MULTISPECIES: RNase H family protein [unclassified Granulicatella]MBF0780685.1 reverse transcriptase-like protein [Granulicatella sp. 19428wC4_WM01]TFU94227.1 reverse transcriptase-like protein [Granulicatella sp. WM01]